MHNNIKNLFQGTIIYTVGSIVPKAINFLLLPIFTIYLSPADYGIIGASQSISSFMIIIFSLVLERGIYRLYHDYKTEHERKIFIGTVFYTIIFISTILTILCFLGNSLFENYIFKSIQFYPYVSTTLLSAYFTSFSLVPFVLLQVSQNPKKYVSISVSLALLKIAFMSIFVLIFKLGALGMLLGDLIPGILMLPIFLKIGFKNCALLINFKILKSTLKFTSPILFSIISGWIMIYSSRIFLEKNTTLSDLGIFSLAQSFMVLLNVFVDGFWSAYSPMFYSIANNENNDGRNKLSKINITFIAFYFILAFSFSFWSEYVVLIFDNRYSSIINILPILILSTVFSQITGIFNGQLYQSKKSSIVMFFSISGALINLALNFIFVPKYGMLGAAWVIVLTNCIILIGQYKPAQLSYYIPMPYFKIFSTLILLILIYISSDYLVKYFNQTNYLILKFLIFCITIFIIFTIFKDQFNMLYRNLMRISIDD